MVAFGLTKADIPEEVVEVWPENWESFWVFEALATQWRAGPGGVMGLDYTAIPSVAEMLGVRKKHLQRIFQDLRVMEAAALHQIHLNSTE
nr:MAG TPA: protein of unknown function DUF1799 [Caudoviricetes sp.]